MKIIDSKQVLWAVLVLAIPSAMQTASLDEVKESSSKSLSSPKIGFTNQLGSAREITKEEAEASDLIRSTLDGDPQAQVLLNSDYCAGYSLDQIKQVLELLTRKNTEEMQAYLAKKDDRSLYELYRLSDYLGLDLSLQDKILTVLAKRIAALAEPKRSLFGSLKSWGSSLWGSSKKERVLENTYDQIDIRFIEAVHAKLAFEFLAHSRILRDHTQIIYSVAYSPDGKQIASGSGHYTGLRIWDAATGAPLHRLQGHTRSIYSVAYSPDGTRIASGSDDRTVRIWDAATGEQVGEPLQGHTDMVNSVAYSPDGTRIASGSADTTVRIWDAATGVQVGAPLQGHTRSVNSVAYSPDGTHIVSGSWDTIVRIWNAATGGLVRTLAGHTDYVNPVAFSPDGKRIVSASDDRTVRIWDASTGLQVGEPLAGHTDWVTSVAFSPDGKRIASGSRDYTVRIWDASTGVQVGEPLQGHTREVFSVVYSPDGKQIASGSADRTVRIWGESAKQLDERIKRWSREKLFKEFSFEAVKAQRKKGEDSQDFLDLPELEEYTGPSPFEQPSDNEASGWFNSKSAKKSNGLVINNAIKEVTADDYKVVIQKVEEGAPLTQQDDIVLRKLEAQLKTAVLKPANVEASAGIYTDDDLEDLLRAERLDTSQRSYLGQVLLRIQQSLKAAVRE